MCAATNAGLVRTRVAVSGGTSSRPGSSQPEPRSRTACHIGSLNCGLAITGSRSSRRGTPTMARMSSRPARRAATVTPGSSRVIKPAFAAARSKAGEAGEGSASPICTMRSIASATAVTMSCAAARSSAPVTLPLTSGSRLVYWPVARPASVVAAAPLVASVAPWLSSTRAAFRLPLATCASAVRPAGLRRNTSSRVPASIPGSAALSMTGTAALCCNVLQRASSNCCTGVWFSTIFCKASLSTTTLPPRSTAPVPMGCVTPPGWKTMLPRLTRIAAAPRAGWAVAVAVSMADTGREVDAAAVSAVNGVARSTAAAPSSPAGRCACACVPGRRIGDGSVGCITGGNTMGGCMTGGCATGGKVIGVTAAVSTAEIVAAGTAPRLPITATAPTSVRKVKARKSSPLGRSCRLLVKVASIVSSRPVVPGWLSPIAVSSSVERAAPSTSLANRMPVLPSGPSTGATKTCALNRSTTAGANVFTPAARPAAPRAMRRNAGSTAIVGRRLATTLRLKVAAPGSTPARRWCAG